MDNQEHNEYSASAPKPQDKNDTMQELNKDNKKLLDVSSEENGCNTVSEEIEKKNATVVEADSAKDIMQTINCDNLQNENKNVIPVESAESDKQQSSSDVNKIQNAQMDEKTEEKLAADNETKISNSENVKESSSKESNNLKRKRKSTIIPEKDSPTEENHTRSKRKKTKSVSDKYCWRCHKESVEAFCSACPRSWHRRCIGGMPPSSVENWICGECATILRAENAETRSTTMAHLTVEQLCLLLKYVVERMRDYAGSEPFTEPVELSEAPNYMDYVVKPMDLNLLEANVQAKLYGSTDAFMADAKWIQHNCIVFNTCGGVYTDTSKLSNAAKQIIKLARQEVSEIEACPDCYAHGRNLPRPQPSWFIEPCRHPHPLVWAKLKGFPFWPAKAMPRINSQGFVDVRFFGEHDRAWVSPRDLYLYSEDPPVPLPRKRKPDMDECVREITRHCRKLELMFGQFKFAPPKVQYNPHDPMQIKLLLPNYDPLHPDNTSVHLMNVKKRAIIKKRASIMNKSKEQGEALTPTKSDTETSLISVGDTKISVKSEGESRIPDISELVKTENIKFSPISGNDTSVDVPKNKWQKHEPEGEKTIVENNKIASLDKSKDIQSEQNNIGANNINIMKQTKGELDKSASQEEETLKCTPNKTKILDNLSTEITLPIKKSLDMSQKKISPLKNNNIKGDNGLGLMNVQKSGFKSIKNMAKVYKPKTRMVDKVNAEKALKSAGDQMPNSIVEDVKVMVSLQKDSHSLQEDNLKKPDVCSTLSTLPAICALENKPSNVHTPVIQTPTKNTIDQSVALLLVVNSGATDTSKQTTLPIDSESRIGITTKSKQESKDPQQTFPVKKESKARKSFPNKSPNYPQILSHSSANIQTNLEVPSPISRGQNVNGSISYQLIPPEAGPLSARLYHGAQDLATKMAQLMEEAYEEAAKTYESNETGSTDNHQATVHFLRLQIERMRWEHQQQLAELKHNTDRILREMRASLEAERLRAVKETRREAEEELRRCVEEIKRKQWCALCGREALFYCCWNTAYCDYPCQKSHWPMHMRSCAQKPAFTSIVTSSAAVPNQQQNHNPKVGNSAGRVYALSHNKLTEISASLSFSCSRNEGNQESS
ncbi:hypothetical protein KM043_007743 [Ampulex compressa]|nr:hypothetical protein KM043_007743 [Ampulex compressa]